VKFGSTITHSVRVLAVACMSLLFVAAGGEVIGPTLVRDIPLSGNATRFDYQSIDRKRKLLFIAHLGDGQLVVFDITRQRIVATIPNVARVHGVLVVPELARAYASATGTNEVVVIDEATLTVTARAPGGVYPDGIAYDPRNQRIFVSDEHGKTVTAIDTKTNKRLATIAIGGDVGNTRYDRVSTHIFSADQTNNELVEIDPSTLTLLHRYPLAGCQGSHGLHIHDTARRAYIACEDNAKLVNFDLDTKKQLQVLPVGDSPDVLAFDAAKKILYVACESGYITTFAETDAMLQPLSKNYVARAAHTIAVDEASHLLYLPLENLNGSPTLQIMRFNEEHQK
jgi:YVTN family beta-propeller protein